MSRSYSVTMRIPTMSIDAGEIEVTDFFFEPLLKNLFSMLSMSLDANSDGKVCSLKTRNDSS